MPHCSRIAAFRHPGDEEHVQDLARFWGAVQDLPRAGEPGIPFVATLDPQGAGWRFSRCPLGPGTPAQLDIETDNLEAEAARLEERGARRIGHLRDRMWLLEVPGGMRLRILSQDRPEVGAEATCWA